MWMGCGRCGHGGHQKCIRLYYREFSASNFTSCLSYIRLDPDTPM